MIRADEDSFDTTDHTTAATSAAVWLGPLVLVPYAVTHWTLQTGPLAWAVILLAFIQTALSITILARGPLRWLRKAIVVVAAVTIFLTVNLIGGIQSINGAWYALIPVLGYMLLDRRGLTATLLLTFVMMCASLAYESTHDGAIDIIPPLHREMFRTMSFGLYTVGMTAFVFVVVSRLDHARRQTIRLNVQLRKDNEARREAESHALAALVARDRFLAATSHEIRTPLTGTLGLTETLLSHSLPPAARVLAETALSSGQQLLATVNDILDYSKLEAGAMEFESIPLDVDDILAECVQIVRSQATPRTQVRMARWSDEPLMVLGDPTRIRQILNNLAGNAVKFTHGGEVVLRAAPVDGGMQLDVEDTGVGIPPEMIERMFVPFEQADASTTRRHGGTGLGLSIVERLVRAMGGNLSIRSELGRGTQVSVFLPTPQCSCPVPPAVGIRVGMFGPDIQPSHRLLRLLGARCIDVVTSSDPVAMARCSMVFVRNGPSAAASAGFIDVPVVLLTDNLSTESVPDSVWRVLECPVRSDALDRILHDLSPSDAPTTETHGAQSEVLVVDDNRVNLLVATNILRRFGVRVTTARSGTEALDLIHQQPFDLVLMDCQMPDMDGFEATRRIRSSMGNASPPVVAFSASVLPNDRAQATDAGMIGFLTKPIDQGALARELPHWLARDDVLPPATD